MTGKSEQVLIKTPQGINATRSGVGLSSKAYAMLKLFDSAMPVAGFKTVCMGAAMSEGEFQVTLDELLKFDHLRIVADDIVAGAQTPSAPGAAKSASAAERRMLLTLDFTVNDVAAVPKTASPAAATAPAEAPPVTAARAAARASSGPVPAGAANEDEARDDKAARLRRETEIRQKLMVEMQPRIEEELRARLRPKLEQELRPKLIAALRPGIEAELRTTLAKELTPRVELELKARFAKSLAARKVADEQAPATPVAATVAAPPPPPAAAPDETLTRLMASVSTPFFTVDRSGVCSYMSPAWAQFSGFDTGEVIGKQLSDFFADKDKRAVTSLIGGIVNRSALRFEQQGELLRKEGGGLWVEVHAAPLTSSSGDTIGVCGALRDATELRRAVDQAEADGLRLLLLVEQIDTGVILEDSQGNIQQANPALCALLSLDAAPYSLEGMPVVELFALASKNFIGPEGFLRRTAEVRAVGEDARGESFVMADGRVLEQDYLAVTAASGTVGHLWLYREMRRTRPSAAA